MLVICSGALPPLLIVSVAVAVLPTATLPNASVPVNAIAAPCVGPVGVSSLLHPAITMMGATMRMVRVRMRGR
jgi:hypothetical protein